jgi:hypothetical protein
VEQDNKLVVMTTEDLKDAIRKASAEGAKVALDKFDKLIKQERQNSADKRLHNTEKLLRNYHMFKLSAENAVYEVTDLEAEESANEILNLMLNREGPGLTVESIKKSVIRTVIILEHIDAMINLYRIYCHESDDPVLVRRFNVLYDRYISSPTLSVKEIAEKYNVTKSQAYTDLNNAKEKISALIFGIDSVK